jgi:hypothetical protein
VVHDWREVAIHWSPKSCHRNPDPGIDFNERNGDRVGDLTDPLKTVAKNDALLPVEILPCLHLSDEKNPRCGEVKELGVAHVLSMNGTTPYEAQWVKKACMT